MIMISTFACNNGLIMTGARVYYTMAQDGVFFKKAAELNKFSVPEWSIWAQCFWASVCLTGKYGDLLDFVVIIVLIFYILTILGIFILRKKCQMPKDHIELLVIRFTCILHSCCYCNLYMLLYTKTSTSGWGVVIMLLGFRFII
jgi:APA family basic amino acid/polyamine antiporter